MCCVDRLKPQPETEPIISRLGIELLLHSLARLRKGLPFVRYRVVEADQLQHFFTFRGQYCVEFLSHRDVPRIHAKLLKHGIAEQDMGPQPALYGRFQRPDGVVPVVLEGGKRGFCQVR